jgi:D-sedoheptulose 7-phosphate isomerase
MGDLWSGYRQGIIKALTSTLVTDATSTTMDPGRAIEHLCEKTKTVRDAGTMLHLVGNGASASMASHFAADWTKNAGVKAMAYNDVACLTAIANDLGYEELFAQPLGWFGKRGDLLVTISSSGNSPNVLKAISVAREKGMHVVTFSGMRPDNASRSLGDLNFYVPGWTYGIVECTHHVLLHAWLDCYMGVRDWEHSAPQVIVPPAR